MDILTAYTQSKMILEKAGVEDAGFEVDVLVQHVTGRRRLELDGLDKRQYSALQKLVRRRAAREPLQYIVGSWPFLQLELQVGPGVLIPRPETEEVCLAGVRRLQGAARPVVLDLCSGTGALALGIQSCVPDAQVTAVELNKKAYGWLCRNVESFKKEHGNAPRPLQMDALEYWQMLTGRSVDMIICNPPYVTAAEYAQLEPELYHEPKTALVPRGGERDGLLFYQMITTHYKAALAPGGVLVFEIGTGQGGAVKEIMEKAGYAGVTVEKDMAGHDRVAVGYCE